MTTRKRLVAGLFGIAGCGVGITWIVLPQRFADGTESARQLGETVPRPVFLVGVGLVVLALWLAAMWLTARLWFRGWRWFWPRYKRVAGIVLPDSPLGQFAAGVTVLLAVIVVIVAALPAMIGPVDDTGGGATEYAGQLGQQGLQQELTSDWGEAVEGDAGPQTTVHQDSGVEGPDTDDDGLPDRWERAGETPDGTPLPDADPDHKDLYVQVNYGESIEPLTDEERRQLGEIWGQMPVENPDGETGIDIHIVDEGSLDEEALIDRNSEYDRYYTEKQLGQRKDIYRQVVYGRLELGSTIGRGSMPGYASVVEGRQGEDHDTRYTPRVGVTTHELLHNTAGRVDGRSHTSEGWLTSTSTDEYLSRATARELNQSGLYGPVH